MVDNRLIIAGAVLILILAIVFWPFGPKSNVHSQPPAYMPPSTVSGNKSAPTTTIFPAHIDFYAINYQYVYSGPASKNGQYCNYQSKTSVTQQSEALNGSQAFFLVINPSSGQCSFDITDINSSTPGFNVTSTEPQVPFYLPPYSNVDIQLNIVAPDANYYGPLTITIHYS